MPSEDRYTKIEFRVGLNTHPRSKRPPDLQAMSIKYDIWKGIEEKIEKSVGFMQQAKVSLKLYEKIYRFFWDF